MEVNFKIRSATVADVLEIFNLILALAEYEKLSEQVTGNVESLQADLFGDRPCIEVIIAETEELQKIVGYALFFTNYSTFLTQRGIYLEDIFVLPEYRGLGIGKSLLNSLIRVAKDRGCGRFEWSVLDWNEPAIAFYQRMGAEVLPEWRICRISL
ncbi:MAG: GNAT family N-acetyltransferase [Oscillatoriales cyanobacterium CG2_30_44_21]|nr:MAG: GNAT family N-acetyltransferase [Oscillatoriales cyanobacterium CG2_30_44_21]